MCVCTGLGVGAAEVGATVGLAVGREPVEVNAAGEVAAGPPSAPTAIHTAAPITAAISAHGMTQPATER
jgi:hypothetical protein